MCRFIDELLDAAGSEKFTAVSIRLGARQMQMFQEWAARYAIGGARPSPGVPASMYDGKPVYPHPDENYRGLVAADGSEFDLPM
jgi:hypothetical protein